MRVRDWWYSHHDLMHRAWPLIQVGGIVLFLYVVTRV